MITIGVMLVVMMRMNVELTLVALVAAPLMAGSAVLFGRRVRSVARARRAAESQVQSHVQQTLSGIHVVQAFGQEDRQKGEFARFADDLVLAQQKSLMLTNFSATWTGLIATLGTGAVLLIGSHQVLQGDLSVGGLLVFVAYLKLFQGQFSRLTRAYTSLQGQHGRIERVLEVLDAAPEVQERPGAMNVRFSRGHVRFTGVSFGYVQGQPVLQHIDLEAAPGETLTIVGASGAGKSNAGQPDPAFPRRLEWQRRNRRARPARFATQESARTDRGRAPGTFPVSNQHWGEHCLWPSGGLARVHLHAGGIVVDVVPAKQVPESLMETGRITGIRR